uniref:Complement factor D n=1 Tax=Marmota marmota marmota TaxID=9994 RepID=A0A8C5ZE11_MARMA
GSRGRVPLSLLGRSPAGRWSAPPLRPHKRAPGPLPGSVFRPQWCHHARLSVPGVSGPPGGRSVCGPASRSDPGRSGSRGACAALPGVRASEWQTPVRRRLGHRAVGAERCALPGRRGRREGAGAPRRALPIAARALQAPVRRAPSGAPPGQQAGHLDHDLLLLQLSEKAALGPAVQPLALQREDRDVAPGTLCDVAGWGVVSHAGRRPDRLQHVLLPVLDRATCNLRTYHDGAITPRMMCAESNRRDSCRGDSGGPLVCRGVVEGVVTSGARVCGNRKKPGIYTRVASYTAWIDGVLAEGAEA